MTVICVSGAFMTTIDQSREDKAAVEKREAARAERVEKLLARICKASPLGKKIVESAIERGIFIGIDGDMGNCLGVYTPSVKYVALDEKAPDEKLLSTIVHECRHSEQNPIRDHSYSVYSNVAEVRALEADAMAHECAAVYQMRKAEPDTYAAFCSRHGGMMKAYEASFEKDKDADKAKSEAFKACTTMRRMSKIMTVPWSVLWKWASCIRARTRKKSRPNSCRRNSAMSMKRFSLPPAQTPFQKKRRKIRLKLNADTSVML